MCERCDELKAKLDDAEKDRNLYHQWYNEAKAEIERLKQELREIHHYYKDSGSDQPGAKHIVKALEDRFEWLSKKEAKR